MTNQHAPWNDDLDRRLTALVAERLSGTEIGERMGKTRNSIIGRCHRLGLKLSSRSEPNPHLARLPSPPIAPALPPEPAPRAARRRDDPWAGAPRPPAPEKPHRHIPGPNAPKAAPTPPPAPREAAESRPIPFLEAGRDVCAWPLWTWPARTGFVCGAPVKLGSSYCACHHAVAWHPTPERRRSGSGAIALRTGAWK